MLDFVLAASLLRELRLRFRRPTPDFPAGKYLKNRRLADGITTRREWDLIGSLNYKARSIHRPVHREIATRGNACLCERPLAVDCTARMDGSGNGLCEKHLF